MMSHPPCGMRPTHAPLLDRYQKVTTKGSPGSCLASVLVLQIRGPVAVTLPCLVPSRWASCVLRPCAERVSSSLFSWRRQSPLRLTKRPPLLRVEEDDGAVKVAHAMAKLRHFDIGVPLNDLYVTAWVLICQGEQLHVVPSLRSCHHSTDGHGYDAPVQQHISRYFRARSSSPSQYHPRRLLRACHTIAIIE